MLLRRTLFHDTHCPPRAVDRRLAPRPLSANYSPLRNVRQQPRLRACTAAAAPPWAWPQCRVCAPRSASREHGRSLGPPACPRRKVAPSASTAHRAGEGAPRCSASVRRGVRRVFGEVFGECSARCSARCPATCGGSAAPLLRWGARPWKSASALPVLFNTSMRVSTSSTFKRSATPFLPHPFSPASAEAVDRAHQGHRHVQPTLAEQCTGGGSP